MMISSAVLALLLASPFATAQRFRPSQNGCLLDQSENVAAKMNCGRRNAVTFAVEWYGANQEELQSWLEVAGCTEREAKAEARWAVAQCQIQAATEHNLELRQHTSSKDARKLSGKRSVRLDLRDGTLEDERPAAKKDDTTTSTSTSTSPTTPASTSSTNPWVLVTTSGGVQTTKTCATEHRFTQTSCTSSIHAGKMSKSCTTAPTETMSCLSGFSCSFATDTGDFSCYEKQGVPLYGWIIAGVLGLAVLFAIFAIFIKCCRQRRKDKKQRKALKEGETDFQSMHMHSMKSMGGDVFSSASTMPASTISDTAPLMAPEYPPEVQTPGNTYHDQTDARGYGR